MFKREILSDSGKVYTTIGIDDQVITFTLPKYGKVDVSFDKRMIPQLKDALDEYLSGPSSV